MTRCTREISKEIYDRSQRHNGFIASEDQDKVWSASEYLGYGVYGGQTFEKDGKFYVSYERGDSCD